jgi:hypothetical protein
MYIEYVDRGKSAEAGAAVVSFSPATIVCTITAVAVMFCFQGGNGQGNGRTRETLQDKQGEFRFLYIFYEEEISRARLGLSG